jgi:Flp pilus assembly protein TadB
MVCSDVCAASLARGDKALLLILQKSEQSLRASALYCYLCGILSLLAGVLAWFVLPLPFLVYFCGGCGVVLLVSGFWYGRAAKKQLLS